MSAQVLRPLSALNRVLELPCLANQQGTTPPGYESVSAFSPLYPSQPEDDCHAGGEGHENLGQKLLGNGRLQVKVIFKCSKHCI